MAPLKQTDKSTDSPIYAAIPDPWFLAAQSAEPLIPSWQFPLDPTHELGGQPTLEAISAAGPVGEALLTAGKYSEAETITFFVKEELKLPVVPGDHLWDEIQDAIAYLELSENKG